MAINNPLSPRLIYNHINGTSHGANATIGSGITMSSLRSASIVYNNVKAAPDTISEWNGYTHEQSMGSITYAVRIATAYTAWGLNQEAEDDVGPGDGAEADGGIVLWRTHDGTNTYIRAKGLSLANNGDTNTRNIYDDSSSSSLTLSTDGQRIMTIPVSDATITVTNQHNFSGTGLSTPVSKTSGTIGAPGSETGAAVLISLGADTAYADSAPYGSGQTDDDNRAIFRIELQAAKSGYATTALNEGVTDGGIVIDCINRASADEQEDEGGE